jgi:DNA-binding transcriptional LysR family regulator
MSINRISLYHLETLIWIERLGTFAAAAEHLNTTQPAISARISELESRLGTKLFQRNGRLMTLTPAARSLMREYQPLWEQLQGLFLRSAGFDHYKGVVRIGAGEIAAATCLPNFVASMKRQWHDLSWEIEIQLTAQLIQGLLAGKIDLAFAAGPIAHPALVAMPIGSVEMIWVASPAFAEKMSGPDAEASFSAWSLPSHSPIYQMMRSSLSGLFKRQPSMSLCNNVRMIIDIITAGDGFSLMPRSMIRRELDERSLVEIMPDRRLAPLVFNVVARSGEGDPIVQEMLRQAQDINF